MPNATLHGSLGDRDVVAVDGLLDHTLRVLQHLFGSMALPAHLPTILCRSGFYLADVVMVPMRTHECFAEHLLGACARFEFRRLALFTAYVHPWAPAKAEDIGLPAADTVP